MQISKSKIYIGITLLLAVVSVYLVYRFVLGGGKTPAEKQKDDYFKLLDKWAKGMGDCIKSDTNPDWRIKIKVSACKHGVTFDQALARDLAYLIEHSNQFRIEVDGVEYTIPYDVLIAWRDARDGRSRYYGIPESDPSCSQEKIKKIYVDEGRPPVGRGSLVTGNRN